MSEADTPAVEPADSQPDRSANDAGPGALDTAPTGALGELHLDLVSEALAPGPDGGDAEPDLEAQRDQWRERAILWRERALAAEVVAKEMGTHLADVRENVEDLRVAMRALAEQQAALSPPSARPRTGWREYVARLLDL